MVYVRNPKGRNFVPKSTRRHLKVVVEYLKAAAAQQGLREPIIDPVRLEVDFRHHKNFGSTAIRLFMCDDKEMNEKVPDIDNLIKLVIEALSAKYSGVLEDDRLVSDLQVTKKKGLGNKET